MRRVVIVQYVLIAVAWVMAFVSWPLRAAELNEFFGWRGILDTAEFVRFLFRQPWALIQHPVWTSPWHTLWLSLVLVGLMLFVLGVSLVRRRFTWQTTGQKVIRGFSLILLAFPLATLTPASWHLPRPLAGMYLLAAAHVLMCVALLLMPAKAEEGGGSAYPVEPPQ